LYRIAQEALQNVIKHAQARGARVELRCDGTQALLRVSDNGCGFEVESWRDEGGPDGSYGLRSMTERAELVGGRLEVRSRPGTGTTVTAVVPAKAGD
jgi:two-component system NarL family sensor kinase